MDRIKKIPYPMSALILGLFALGNLILTESPAMITTRKVIGVIAGILYILYLVKIFSDFSAFREALNNPIIGSVIQTWPMATGLFAQYLKPLAPGFAKVLWYIGLVLFVILLIKFITTHITKNFKIQKVFASWFVAFCGIGVWSITAPAFEALKVGQIGFYFGFISLIILSPVVISRVLKHPIAEPPQIPTTTIFAAPSALLLAGYIQSFPEKNKVLFFILLAITAVYYIIGLVNFVKNMMKPFNPAFAAYTFPLVISGIATKMSANVLNAMGYAINIKWAVIATQWIAIIAIVYVFMLYMNFVFIEK